MGYNTRKKSFSIADLGITLPKRARASSVTQPSPPASVVGEEPIPKKPKWSHGSTTPPPSKSMSPPASTNIRIKPEPPSRLAEHTPPPSPGTETIHKIDTDGIKDDVVVGTIRQLEKTGNRPHLVKELAAVLCHNIAAVEKSANPANLISSRLTSYLNRVWPTISQCPLAKYQSTVHPRPLYYFLTTQPHQPIPEMNQSHETILAARRVVSPPLSSGADEEEAKYKRGRDSMSPSPEVDLSSPELEDDESNSEMSSSFTHQGPLSREHPPTSTSLSHNRRAESPPLEKEERDFKQTANALQELRRTSQDNAPSSKPPVLQLIENVAVSVEGGPMDSEESIAIRHENDAAALFADHGLSNSVSTIYDFSSPMLKPFDRHQEDSGVDSKIGHSVAIVGGRPQSDGKQAFQADPMVVDLKAELTRAVDSWNPWLDGDLMSPENVDLDELECLFDDF